MKSYRNYEVVDEIPTKPNSRFVVVWMASNGIASNMYVIDEDGKLQEYKWGPEKFERIREHLAGWRNLMNERMILVEKPKRLLWDYGWTGEYWTAESLNHHDEGTPFSYRIRVTAKGKFTTEDTDEEITLSGQKMPKFDTLKAAKKWCAEWDDDTTPHG